MVFSVIKKEIDEEATIFCTNKMYPNLSGPMARVERQTQQVVDSAAEATV